MRSAGRAERERVSREAFLLADRLADAGRHLARALAEKERLARILDGVLETLGAGVALAAGDGTVIATNRAAREHGVVGAGGRVAPPFDRFLGDEGDGRVVLEGPAGRRHFLVRSRAMSLPGGRDGRLLVAEEVTRVVELEEETRRRTRLEALGRMAAEVAHEVRNPLGSLELLASLLLDDLEDDAPAREMAERILLEVRRLAGTVTRLLAAVRGRRARRVPVDPVALAREVVEALDPVACAREVGLRVRAEPGAGNRARLDAEGVRRALLNLVGNGLEATPAGGEVRVTVLREEDRVVFLVDDSGPGIPRELRERIFEPFFSTRTDGTGLGLAVVEQVTLAHGGLVRVGESPLGGARFRVELPAGEPGAGEVAGR